MRRNIDKSCGERAEWRGEEHGIIFNQPNCKLRLKTAELENYARSLASGLIQFRV